MTNSQIVNLVKQESKFKVLNRLKMLMFVLVLLLGYTNIFAQDRIFWQVEQTGLIAHIEANLLPTYLPNGKSVYWQFSSIWSTNVFSDKTEIKLHGDSAGLANVWVYGYYNNTSNASFPVVSDGVYMYPFIFTQSIVNNAFTFANTDIRFRSDKFLPEEHDWKTCKEFLTHLVATNPNFYDEYENRMESCVVVVTLGYSANDFAGQDTTTLYWSVAWIDTTAGQQMLYYCYADAYDLENMNCYHTSIEENLQVNSIKLFPNPTVSDFTVSFDLEKSCNVQILLCDILGKELLQFYDGFASAGAFSRTFSTESLAKGIYFLKILIDGNSTVEKIIVE